MKLNVRAINHKFATKSSKNEVAIATTATTTIIIIGTINWHRFAIILSLLSSSTLPHIGTLHAATTGRPYFWQILFGKTDAQQPTQSRNDYDKAYAERANWTTADWITANNYTCEQHNVTTADGYQLQLQRLPRIGQRPILLLHGLLMSSLSWVLMGANRSLAFQLHDRGYDVWLANFRGSRDGQQHRYWNTTQSEFWSFSFHEHGLMDMPSIIDYVREMTSFHQLLLVAHSQAFNAFLVLCSSHWEYNDRILLIQALAPIADLRNLVRFKNADMLRVRKFLKQREKSKEFEVFPRGFLKQKCWKSTEEQQKQCASYMKTFAGSGQFSKSLYPLIYDQLLQGGSLKELTHLEQIWRSGDFVSFDYGVNDNPTYYNAVQPLLYNLTKITVPIVLHFGETDAIATPKAVHHTYSHLLASLTSILGVYRVTANKFNHLDFLLSSDVKKLVNDKLIDIMERFLSGKLQYVIE